MSRSQNELNQYTSVFHNAALPREIFFKYFMKNVKIHVVILKLTNPAISFLEMSLKI